MTRQAFDTIDVLRLDVEDTPAAGAAVSLVVNPSGEFGGYGWVTPLAGTAITASSDFGGSLAYVAPGGGPSYFYTEAMSVEVGQYVVASWVMPRSDGADNWVRPRYEWLDIDGAVLSQTAQGAYRRASTDTVAYGPYTAPSGAAAVRLRFDQTGFSNPTAGQQIRLQKVTVVAFADLADAAPYATVLHNWVTNPRFAGGSSTGWSLGPGTGGAAAFAVIPNGGGEQRGVLTPSAAGTTTRMSAQTSIMPITVATADVVPVLVRTRETNSTMGTRGRIRIQWYAGATLLGSAVTGEWFSVANSGTEAELSAAGAVPAGTDGFRLIVEYERTSAAAFPAGSAGRVDFSWVIVGATDFFDGTSASRDLGPNWTYAWDGTAGLSSSTATGWQLEFVPDATYTDVLGPTLQIEVDRGTLSVGVLTATIGDAALDPSQDDLIRPGKRVRLVSKVDPLADEILFAGKVDVGTVEYLPAQPDAAHRAKVTLRALDATNVLVSHPRAEGVASIGDLPYVLEGCEVPWSVNGSGDQVSSATVVARNDSATAVDQVAITRDTNLGFAWVDRRGVLQAWDRDEISSTVVAELDEDDYNADIAVGYDTSHCINVVTVKVLRINAATGETAEVTFGPYIDAESVRQWGPRSAEFTIQVEVDDPVAIAAYAAEILAANATPAVRVTGLVLPVTTTALVGTTPLLDLCDLVEVTRPGASTPEALRVTSLQHSISPAKWLVRVGFESPEGVAAPRVTPPLRGATPNITQASGVQIVTVAASAQGFVDVDFPGEFASTPVVVATTENAAYYAAVAIRTVTGFRLYAIHRDGTSASASVSVCWMAVKS